MYRTYISGADPGLDVGGGTNPLGGHGPNIFIHFLKNPMKLKKFWPVGGRTLGAPPGSATASDALNACHITGEAQRENLSAIVRKKT